MDWFKFQTSLQNVMIRFEIYLSMMHHQPIFNAVLFTSCFSASHKLFETFLFIIIVCLAEDWVVKMSYRDCKQSIKMNIVSYYFTSNRLARNATHTSIHISVFTSQNVLSMQFNFRTNDMMFIVRLYRRCCCFCRCKLNLSQPHNCHPSIGVKVLKRKYVELCRLNQKNDGNCYGNGKRPKTGVLCVCVAKIMG